MPAHRGHGHIDETSPIEAILEVVVPAVLVFARSLIEERSHISYKEVYKVVQKSDALTFENWPPERISATALAIEAIGRKQDLVCQLGGIGRARDCWRGSRFSATQRYFILVWQLQLPLQIRSSASDLLIPGDACMSCTC